MEIKPCLRIPAGDLKNQYDYVSDYSWQGFFVVELEGKKFHLNELGNPAYGERYDWVSMFNEGLAAVKNGTEYFHIDEQGKPAYEERYDEVTIFKRGFCWVYKDGKEFTLDHEGNIEPFERTMPSDKNRA